MRRQTLKEDALQISSFYPKIRAGWLRPFAKRLQRRLSKAIPDVVVRVPRTGAYVLVGVKDSCSHMH